MPDICILLCGGEGNRFQNQTCYWPKPMNLVEGKPLFYWNINSLNENLFKSKKETWFVIAYNKVLEEYNFPSLVNFYFPNLNFQHILIPYLTRGPLETLYICLNELRKIEILSKNSDDALKNSRVFICDNDIIINKIDLSVLNNIDLNKTFLYVEHNTEKEPLYSYIVPSATEKIHLDTPFEVIDVKEKEKSSDWIYVGLCGSSFEILSSECKCLLENKPVNTNEYYISHIFTSLCNKKKKVVGIPISEGSTCILGTPENIKCNGYNVWNNNSKKLRIVVDLDNTLVSYPLVKGNYSTVNINQWMVKYIRKLKEEGHYIIIHTARRMETHSHNVGKVIADIGKLTIETLDKFNIPYDEIIFGKPLGDIYIDDRAVNPWDPYFVQNMGFYRLFDSESAIRKVNNTPFLECTSHNKHILNTKGHLIKTGPKNVIQGERYFYETIKKFEKSAFYNFIPKMFPEYFGDTENISGISLELEYIKSIPLSMIYQYTVVSEDLFGKVLKEISSLHSSKFVFDSTRPHMNEKFTNELVNLNYINKFKERYSNQKYYSFIDKKECDSLYDYLLKKLENYVNNRKSKELYVHPTLIHGDCWFSNILITRDNKIKFIDPKGTLYGELTINGDPVYDWAKIFQSIVGFDSIVVFREKIDIENYPEEFRKKKEKLLNILREFTKDKCLWEDIVTVSCCLMFGSFWAFHDMLDDDLKKNLFYLIEGEISVI